MKKLFLVLVLCLCSLASWAQNNYDFSAVAPTGQMLYYKINSATHSVTVTHPNSDYSFPWNGYTSPSGSLTIPSSVTLGAVTYLVTSIDDHAFLGCSGLTSVTIPNSVSTIGDAAFSMCSGLTTLYVPNSVTTIGIFAFYGIDIVYYRGDSAGSPWGADNVITTGFTAEGDPLVYEDPYKTMVVGCSDTATRVTIPNSVTTIGSFAFDGCSSLASVTIPNSVTTIGSYAFFNCSSLSGVTIPNSVISIGELAFSHCDNLTSVTIGESVTSIGNAAFDGCSSLASVTIPSSVTSIGINAFYNVDRIVYCGTATGRPWGAKHAFAVLQDGLCFQDCDMTIVNGFENGLIHADIPDGVTTIAANAFENCSTLATVTIPESVTTIENQAFEGCTNVTTLNYNAKNLTTSSDWSTNSTLGFRPMRLQNIVVGEGVESLPDYVFYSQNFLTSVTLPSTLTSIGEKSFYESIFSSIDIPSGVSSIGKEAFMGCFNLSSISIPQGVTRIEEGTFNGCRNLASIVIKSSIDNIGTNAFAGCSNLKTVYNLSNLSITKGADTYGYVAKNALRVLSATNGGFTNHGTGENTLHQISTDYTIVAAEDDNATSIPQSSIPPNFIYRDNSKDGSWKAKEIILTDGQDEFEAPETFTADTVTYTREFTDGHRSTLYLPFTAAIPEDFEVYEFSDFDGNILYFQEPSSTDSIRAYTPYLVGYGLEKSTTKCVISQKNAKFPATAGATPAYTTTHGGMTFQGTLARTGDLSTNNYGYKDGFFVQSGGAAHVNPFRCYFTYSGGGAGQMPPHTLSVAFGDGLLGIDTAETPATNGSIRYSNDVYDLMGRLVRKDAATLDGLPTGIYVWKGRKVLAR